jgi:hypothetical protein
MKFVIIDDDQIIYDSPLRDDMAVALQDLLRRAKCLCPSFDGVDPYLIETYVTQFATHHTDVKFIIDRNMYSHVLALARGAVVTEKTQVAAAVMAFASCVNAQVEPNLAIYEGSASGATGGWRRNLGLFYRAEEIHPGNWALLALGCSPRFERPLPSRRIPMNLSRRFNPQSRIKSYEFVYPITLKLALIFAEAGNPDSKMSAFIEWMYKHWQFSAPATILASQVLSRDPPPRVFKSIGSTDRKMALAGVRNAAWDLVYLTEWYKAIKAQSQANTLNVLCSRDSLLLRLAELFRRALFDGDQLTLLEQAGFGTRVQRQYEEYTAHLDDSKRALVPFPDDFEAYRKVVLATLEGQLLGPGSLIK